jgi:hypothetical protein
MRNLHMGPTLARLEPRHPLTCLKADAQAGTVTCFGVEPSRAPATLELSPRLGGHSLAAQKTVGPQCAQAQSLSRVSHELTRRKRQIITLPRHRRCALQASL